MSRRKLSAVRVTDLAGSLVTSCRPPGQLQKRPEDRTWNAGVAVRTADGSRRTADAGDEQCLSCACNSPSCIVVLRAACILPVAVARSSSAGVVILPVLWMTSYLLICQLCSTSPPAEAQCTRSLELDYKLRAVIPVAGQRTTCGFRV